MCRRTDLKIDDARVPDRPGPGGVQEIHDGGAKSEAPLPLEKVRRKSSGRNISVAAAKSAAFKGSKFDKQGYCLSHPTVKLVQPLKDANGKVIYEELRSSCPSCQAEKHKKKRTTSLGGKQNRIGRSMHGMKRDKSPARSRSRSKSRDPNTAVRQYSTPFDDKGRCHYHTNVQLAAKKFGGGWKVLHPLCPKCMEDRDDEQSVKSSRSTKSSRSLSSSSVNGNANGQHNKNGCCVLHPHIQVAKKAVFGRGWKIIRTCPACDKGSNIGLDDDNISIKSSSSRRSTRSTRSTRSSTSSRSSSRPGKAASSSRYGALPFNEDGFCCRHPSVQLAKKKALGGFRIIHHTCPECERENGRDRSSSRSRSRRRRSGSRVLDESGSETSSLRSSSKKTRRVRVKNLKTGDKEGKVGRYTGYVDDEHKPNGQGTIEYKDGTSWSGVWEHGSKVHAKGQ